MPIFKSYEFGFLADFHPDKDHLSQKKSTYLESDLSVWFLSSDHPRSHSLFIIGFNQQPIYPLPQTTTLLTKDSTPEMLLQKERKIKLN